VGPRIWNPVMNSLFLSKISVNEPAPSPPTGTLWGELPVFKAFYISLKFLIKIILNK
jgi:hypothetical protein